MVTLGDENNRANCTRDRLSSIAQENLQIVAKPQLVSAHVRALGFRSKKIEPRNVADL